MHVEEAACTPAFSSFDDPSESGYLPCNFSTDASGNSCHSVMKQLSLRGIYRTMFAVILARAAGVNGS